jgi:hypothetical protein
MPDNTTLPGVGDVVRDLDRQAGGIKTPVTQIDVGGPSTSPESLVSRTNPMPTQEAGPVVDLLQELVRLMKQQNLLLAALAGPHATLDEP